MKHFQTSFQEIEIEPNESEENYFPKPEVAVIIASIRPENAEGERYGKKENYFRPWIQPAFRLMAATGLRLSELANLRWSMVIERGGQPFLRIPSWKSKSAFQYIPLSGDAREILLGLSFETKTINQYIIAPERVHRPYVQNFLHHAFRHFAMVAVPGGEITIQDVRRNFIVLNCKNL